MKRRLASSVVLLASAAAAAPAHEFVPPDPREDVLLGSTTPIGDLPSALETSSGLVSSPDPFRLPRDLERAYSRTQSADATFTADRDTRPVPQVEYEDPFSPSVAPYKRLSAFDAAGADGALSVADRALRKVIVGGAPAAGDDAFFGDVVVDLVPNEPVRVPSPGAGTRVLRATTQPPTQIELLRDGAENLFVKAGTRGRVRVILFVATPRSAFGGPLRDAAWGELPATPPLPRTLQEEAEGVLRAIGVSRAMPYREAVAELVRYFRSFAATDAPIEPARGDLYLDLALSKKGVCRHRAYAFVITALALRVPARFVLNEAHAWVEVHDGASFRRVDLGGAAENFADATGQDRPQHRAPDDPFAWPPGSRPGREMVAPAGSTGGDAPSPSARPSTSAPTSGGQAPGAAGAPAVDQTDDRAPAIVTARFLEQSLRRGEALHVEGTVRAAGSACGSVRVDVVLRSADAQATIGTLATGADGAYQGAILIPPSLALGSYDVSVQTPGDQRCGTGRSE